MKLGIIRKLAPYSTRLCCQLSPASTYKTMLGRFSQIGLLVSETTARGAGVANVER